MKTVEQIRDQARFTTLIVTMLLMICIMWWNRRPYESLIAMTIIVPWFALYLHRNDVLCDLIEEDRFFKECEKKRL